MRFLFSFATFATAAGAGTDFRSLLARLGEDDISCEYFRIANLLLLLIVDHTRHDFEMIAFD